MTVDELVEELVYEVGAAPADIETRAQFQRWINDAVEEILAEGPYPTLNNAVGLSLVADTPEYAVSSLTADLRAITENSTGRPLTYLPPDELVARQLRLDVVGPPAYWWFSGYDEGSDSVLIRVWPTPDTARVYTAFGHPRLVSSLVGDSTIPLPSDFVRVVRNYVRAMAAELQVVDDAGRAEAERKQNRYVRSLEQLKDRFKAPVARWARMQPVDVPRLDPFGVPQFPEHIS